MLANLPITLTVVCILSLVTTAIVLIFRTSYTTNFAQSSIAVFSAYMTTHLLVRVLPNFLSFGPTLLLIVSIILGLMVGFLFGFFIDTVLIRLSKFTNSITKQMITMGFILVISGLLPITFGVNVMPNPTPLMIGGFQFQIGSTTLYITYHNLLSIVIALVTLSGLFIALKYTKWGLGVRSTASNEKVASMMGVNTKFITAMSWGIAGALGALAANLFAPIVMTLEPYIMLDMQINGFLSGVMGGFSSFGGPIAASFIIIFGRLIMRTYISSQWATALMYIFVLVVILIKPVGLFGKKIAKKV